MLISVPYKITTGHTTGGRFRFDKLTVLYLVNNPHSYDS
jgi:hypothetical protein